MSRRRRNEYSRWRSLFLWHRYLGLSSALLVLLLASTGLLLNHTGNLNLDSRYVKSTVVLDWYGISVPTVISYNADGRWITQLGEHLFFDRQELLQDPAPLLGALQLKNEWIIVLQQALLLVNEEGQLIERLSNNEGIPVGMRRVGQSLSGKLVIDTEHGFYVTDNTLLDWYEVEMINNVRWAQLEELPVVLYEQLQQQYRGIGLTLERVVLDMHSGRILGPWGIYLLDAAAVALLLLAIMGVWVWRSRKK